MKRFSLLAVVCAALLVFALTRPDKSAAVSNDRPSQEQIDREAAAEFKVLGVTESKDLRVVYFTLQWNKPDPLMSLEATVAAYRMADQWLEQNPGYEKDGQNPYHFHNNSTLVLFVKKKAK